MLGDKGKPLSGDNGTRTDKHNPNIEQGRMEHVHTNVHAYEQDRSVYYTHSKRQMNDPSEEKTKDFFVQSAHSFW